MENTDEFSVAPRGQTVLKVCVKCICVSGLALSQALFYSPPSFPVTVDACNPSLTQLPTKERFCTCSHREVKHRVSACKPCDSHGCSINETHSREAVEWKIW